MFVKAFAASANNLASAMSDLQRQISEWRTAHGTTILSANHQHTVTPHGWHVSAILVYTTSPNPED